MKSGGVAQVEPLHEIVNNRRSSRMMAANAINLMKLPSADPKSKRQIQELMDHFDKDHDGRLDASEILNLHNTLVKKQKQDQNLRNVAFCYL